MWMFCLRSICPVHAIEMKTDLEGFLYPEIDNVKCISCNLCNLVCNFKPIKRGGKELDIPLAYGVKHNVNLKEIVADRERHLLEFLM